MGLICKLFQLFRFAAVVFNEIMFFTDIMGKVIQLFHQLIRFRKIQAN